MPLRYHQPYFFCILILRIEILFFRCYGFCAVMVEGRFNNKKEIYRMINKNIKTKSFLFLTFPVLASTSVAQPPPPPDLGWRWIGSTVGFRNLAPNFTPYFSGAASEITAATGLTFFTSPNQNLLPPFTGDVAFEEVNDGTLYWYGNATGYNIYNQPCSNPVTGAQTGNCTGGLNVSYAHIRFNNYYGGFGNYEMMHLIRHEFGHVLGMGHGGCELDNSPHGIMAPGIGNCYPIFINYS